MVVFYRLIGLKRHNYALYFCFVDTYICIYIYGEKNIILVLVPRVDSDK